MNTQASKLQQIIDNQSNEEKQNNIKTKIIAITSGKGGVGKSMISANIANLLSLQGYNIALFDADIGLANLDVILGVRAKENLLDVLKGNCQLKDIILPIKENLVLIPGESGDEILNFDKNLIMGRLAEDAKFLDSLDYLIIDTGAGIGERVQMFLKEADEIIVVTIPEPSAITDAYATIKVTSRFNNNISMIVNMVQSPKEGKAIFDKIKHVADNNLSNALKLDFMGYLSENSIVSKSARERKLFTDTNPNSTLYFELNEIIKTLIIKLEHKVLENKGRKSFAVFVRRLIENF
jgi:flagellar biosynthesis protein FlhG